MYASSLYVSLLLKFNVCYPVSNEHLYNKRLFSPKRYIFNFQAKKRGTMLYPSFLDFHLKKYKSGQEHPQSNYDITWMLHCLHC